MRGLLESLWLRGLRRGLGGRLRLGQLRRGDVMLLLLLLSLLLLLLLSLLLLLLLLDLLLLLQRRVMLGMELLLLLLVILLRVLRALRVVMLGHHLGLWPIQRHMLVKRHGHVRGSSSFR